MKLPIINNLDNPQQEKLTLRVVIYTGHTIVEAYFQCCADDGFREHFSVWQLKESNNMLNLVKVAHFIAII